MHFEVVWICALVLMHGVFNVPLETVWRGDPITLHTNTTINQNVMINWYFKGTPIAEIDLYSNKTCTDVQCNEDAERFRGRLKLDHQTGSLTIMNTRRTDSGEYRLEINKTDGVNEKTFTVFVESVFRVAYEFVIRGDPVTLHTDTTINQNVTIKWYFRGTLIAEMDLYSNKTCPDVQCNEDTETFRGRLKLDHQTGSLTIMNTRGTDSGDYHLETDGPYEKIFKVYVRAKACGSQLDASDAGYITSPGYPQKYPPNQICQWLIRAPESSQAIMLNFNPHFELEIGDDCRYDFIEIRDGNSQSADLLGKHCGNIAPPAIASSGPSIHIKFVSDLSREGIGFSLRYETGVSVDGVQEGDSVKLHTGVTINLQDKIKWYFNHVQITGDQKKNCTDNQCKESFTDRLKLDNTTGSLTIMKIKTSDSGLYELQINREWGGNITRSFIVSVTSASAFGSDGVFVMEEDSVILHTGVETNQQNKTIWYYDDTRIAQINGDLSFICTDVQCNEGTEKFTGRLDLNHQTGSLTIMNLNTTDSGLYALETNNTWSSTFKDFRVTFNSIPPAERKEMKSKSVTMGESVTLDIGEIKTPHDLMIWYFEEIQLAKVAGDQSKIFPHSQLEKEITSRYKMSQTGSLTITDTRKSDTGLYLLKISNVRFTIIRSFNVTITGLGLSALGVIRIISVSLLVILAPCCLLCCCKLSARRKEMRAHYSHEKVNVEEDLSIEEKADSLPNENDERREAET